MNGAGGVRDLWPFASAALVLAGLALQSGALAVLGFGMAIAFGTATLWARYSLRRLDYERAIPEDHAFPGESISITLRITNRKPLPLPWVEVNEQFPEDIADAEGGDALRPAGHPGFVGLEWRTATGPYDRVSRGVSLKCTERGVYEVGPVTLQSGDPFGLFRSERTDTRRSRIVVYPMTVALPEVELPSRRPFGESSGGLRVYEDPSRVAGIRDYAPGDSLRRIDWNATARTGKLQSRVYDPTSSQHLLVCLNTQTMEPAWAGYIPSLLERAVSVAASIARDAFDQRFAVGILANASVLDADRPIRLPPGRRPEQLIRILESLAVVSPFVLLPIAVQLDREEHRLAVGTTIALVTAVMPPDLATTLARLRRRGNRIIVLSTAGADWRDILSGIPVCDVSIPELDGASAAADWSAPTA